MPGVPSSRACDACMKQKKKCDRSLPACARCTRLQIVCVGANVQRYKFFRIDGKRLEGTTHLIMQSSATPSRPFRNGRTKMTTELLHHLSVQDVRHDLCYAYGPLLREIPKRIGASQVLDSSAWTLILTSRDLSTNQRSEERLVSYGRTLASLRNALQDPKEACSPLTLCAIFVIWICQAWIGGDQSNCPGHGAGLMKLLSASSLRSSNDTFERQLLPTLIVPIIFESAFDPAIKLKPWMLELVLGRAAESRINRLTCLLRLPELLRFDATSLSKLMSFYEVIRTENLQLRVKLESTQDEILLKAYTAKLYADLGMTCGISILLNEAIQVYKPCDEALIHESLQLYEQILHLASQTSKFLPLAASWVPIALEMAWVACADHARRSCIEKVWERCWTPASASPFGVSKRFLDMFDTLRAEALMCSGLVGSEGSGMIGEDQIFYRPES